MTVSYAPGYDIISDVDSEVQDRVVKAGRRYQKAEADLAAARADLAQACLAAKRDPSHPSNETIARLTPLSNTHIFRLIKNAEAADTAAKS